MNRFVTGMVAGSILGMAAVVAAGMSDSGIQRVVTRRGKRMLKQYKCKCRKWMDSI